MLHLNISLKNFCASPSRFRFISVALRLWRFSFFFAVSLALSVSLLSFRECKGRNLFSFCKFFLKILFFVFLAPSLIFNPFQHRAFWFVFPLFGVAKVRFFFHFCKKFFKLFSRFFSALFSILRLPCAARFLLPRFVLGLQRWGSFSIYPSVKTFLFEDLLQLAGYQYD